MFKCVFHSWNGNQHFMGLFDWGLLESLHLKILFRSPHSNIFHVFRCSSIILNHLHITTSKIGIAQTHCRATSQPQHQTTVKFQDLLGLRITNNHMSFPSLGLNGQTHLFKPYHGQHFYLVVLQGLLPYHHSEVLFLEERIC